MNGVQFLDDLAKDQANLPDFPPPLDLFNQFSLPRFPVDLFPQVIADFAKDQAELLGVDPAIICMTALAGAAGCIDDRILIQPKRHDPTWTESSRLWIAIIGDPSTKKTPGMTKALSPVFKIDSEWRKESNSLLAEWETTCKGLDKNETKPEKPLQKRLTVNDVTVEKLGMILENMEPRGILSVQDELSGWTASMDTYKNRPGGDIAAWLEAYNGGPKSFDRVSRESAFVDNWSVSVVGGIQPAVVHAYANAANHDGMLQRFALVHAEDCTLGQDRMPNMQAKEAYEWTMRQLASLSPPSPGQVVKLTEESHQAREEVDARLLQAVRSIPNKFLSAALGKWSGLFARLLLTFHCIECATDSVYPTNRQVSGESGQRVARLMMRTLLPHAVRFYAGIDETEDRAQALASLILARGWERFTVKRDLGQNMKAFRRLKPWEIEETLDRLEAYGWLSPEPGRLTDRGKPAAYFVNPEAHRRFTEQAERERERRQEVTEFMAELRH